MKTIEYEYDIIKEYELNHYFKKLGRDSEFLFFDIETTGFVARNTTLYLIGALYYRDNRIHVIQWFNEDGYSEKDLIMSFCEFAKSFPYLVHFNGNGFDLPYLYQKAEMLHLPFDVKDSMVQIDLLKEAKPLKDKLQLENLKLKTIEVYLGIKRKDAYSGQELINIYQRYVAHYNEEYERLLLLHNHDDLLGMPGICQILNYKEFFNNITLTTCEFERDEHTLFLHFDFTDETLLPKRLLYGNDQLYLNAFETHATLTIPIYSGTLRHFYPDYKNYYYLPFEDVAIHKSVATYVETCNRQKATKETCYVKRSGEFTRCFDDTHPEVFKEQAKSKLLYRTLDSVLAFNITEKHEYVQKALLSMF